MRVGPHHLAGGLQPRHIGPGDRVGLGLEGSPCGWEWCRRRRRHWRRGRPWCCCGGRRGWRYNARYRDFDRLRYEPSNRHLYCLLDHHGDRNFDRLRNYFDYFYGDFDLFDYRLRGRTRHRYGRGQDYQSQPHGNVSHYGAGAGPAGQLLRRVGAPRRIGLNLGHSPGHRSTPLPYSNRTLVPQYRPIWRKLQRIIR